MTDAQEPATVTKEYFGPYENWIFINGREFGPLKPGSQERQKLPGTEGHGWTALGAWNQPLAPQQVEPAVTISATSGGQTGQPVENEIRFDVTPLIFERIDSSNTLPRQFWPLLLTNSQQARPFEKPVIADGLTGESELRFSPAGLFDEGFATLAASQLAVQGFRFNSATGDLPDIGFIATDNTTSLDADFRFNFPVDKVMVNRNFEPGSDIKFSVDQTTKHNLSNSAKPLVIVAVIDDGLPFAHHNFQTEEHKTRIEFCWLQSAIADGGNSVPFGREHTRKQIEDLFERHGNDEDAIYNDPDSGSVNSHGDLSNNMFRHYTHGAHVMDTAAGIGPSDTDINLQDAERLRIIGVQLPRESLRDSSGFGKDVFILTALNYVLARAKLLKESYEAKEVSLLINLSLGITGGIHNGKSQIELAMDEALNAWKTDTGDEVVLALPSANSFADRMHATIPADRFSENKPQTIHWRIQPNDRTSNYLEFWFRPNDNRIPKTVSEFIQMIDINLGVPGSANLLLSQMPKETQSDEQLVVLIKVDEKTIGQMSLDLYRGLQWRLLIITAPTEPFIDHVGRAPSGVWPITINTVGDAPPHFQNVEIFIHRDEDPASTGNGSRQSYLDDPNYRLYNQMGKRVGQQDEANGYVNRFGTINGWATSPNRTEDKLRYAVGGYIDTLEEPKQDHVVPARYSGAGNLSAQFSDPIVDFSAPSDISELHHGIKSAGTRSGAIAYLQGTSSAAPSLIRHIAANRLVGLETVLDSNNPDDVWQSNDDVLKARLGKVFLKGGRVRSDHRH